MANALDAFRAQREAVDQMQTRLGELSDRLERLRAQVDGLALHKDLKDTLRKCFFSSRTGPRKGPAVRKPIMMATSGRLDVGFRRAHQGNSHGAHGGPIRLL
jgi:hypothetical protein